jgi:WD40 repeat protein
MTLKRSAFTLPRLLRLMIVFLALLLAACGQETASKATLTPGFAPVRSDTVTQSPAVWVESAMPITLDNVDRITNLGRLDAPDTPSTVFAYAFSPDSTRLVALNNDLLLGWNLQTGALLFRENRGDAVQVFYSVDKTEVYSLSGAGNIAAYDAETGDYKEQFPGHASYSGISAYNTENGWLALGGLDGTVKVWDLLERRSLVTLDAHERTITALAFTPDGARLATASGGGIIYGWDWQTKTRLATMTMSASRTPLRLAFAPDGAQLASATQNEIQLWSMADGALEHALDIGPGGASELMRYSPDGRFLVNGGSVPAMTIWNPADGNLLTVLPGVGGDRTAAAFSPGSDLLVTAVLGKPVSLWATARFGGENLQQANLPLDSNTILSAAWTDDGFLVVLFDATGSVFIWGIAPQG